MTPLKATPLQLLVSQHIPKWKDCTRCALHTGRQYVVLGKGDVPCDILFVGEAPGDSEDVSGVPFDGPAGQRLDQIIRQVIPPTSHWRLSYTNIVACFPREQKREGTNAPPAEAIKACAPRLKEFVRIVQPRLIVGVGDLAAKYACVGQAQYALPYENNQPAWLNGKPMLFTQIIHPAALLRMKLAEQGYKTRQQVVILRDAVESLEE